MPYGWSQGTQVICSAPSWHHLIVLGVPGHLQCAVRAPYGRSQGATSSAVRPPAPYRCCRGARSSAVHPHAALPVLPGRQVICLAPSGRPAGVLGAPGHALTRCEAKVLAWLWVLAPKKAAKTSDKMPENAVHHRWVTFADLEPLVLWYISHISGGGRPPNFTVLESFLCVCMQAPAWDGHQGAEEATFLGRSKIILSKIFVPNGFDKAI